MMAAPLETWSGGLRQTFRILPEPAQHLRPFLENDGATPTAVLAVLPYESARAPKPGSTPDPKRYRDPKQVYQTVGLVYEHGGALRVTALGVATLRWLDLINEKNSLIIGRHAAYALGACQLRNPTGAGRRYADDVEVFPFAFIWRAMLALENRLSSDELNRAIFRVKNEEDLEEAIDRIAEAREKGDPDVMGEETITESAKNDRVIPWVAMASFGWTLFPDKRGGGGYYELPPKSAALLADAVQIKRRHREFDSVEHYVRHLSRAAALPPDLR